MDARVARLIAFLGVVLMCASAQVIPIASGQAPIGNLRIQKARYFPSYIHVNKNATIEVFVQNEGPEDLTNIWVYFYLHDVELAGAGYIDSLAAGANKSVEFQWTPTEGGPTRLKYIVDPKNEINETNEDDNVQLDKVTVRVPSDTPSSSPCPGSMSIGIIPLIAIYYLGPRRPRP
jgi:subtilase family serine protease